jgi:LysR family transcriptional regulator, benzoate and cis,cis-muconate-responsive activator of ben and cat genes
VTLRICTMAERVLDGPLRVVVWSRSHEHRDLYGIVLGVVPFGVVLLQAYLLATLARSPCRVAATNPW